MTIEIRPIKPGEGPALLVLTRALAEAHDYLDKYTATAGDLERALFAPVPIVGCLIAFCDGEPAGCAFWHRSFTTARGREIMYLEDLSVLPAYQRRGIGRALLQRLAVEARDRGFPSIYWLTMGWNAKAQALYDQTGATCDEGMRYYRLADEALIRLAEAKP
nr:Acetyltransferase (GNAT) family [uncultured bacterium]